MTIVLLTVEEVAARLDMACEHIQELAACGALEAARTGDSWRFEAEAVDRFQMSGPQTVPLESLPDCREATAADALSEGVPPHCEDAENYLWAVVNSIADGVVAADEQGGFVVFNPAAKEIIGKGAADMPPEEWSRHYGLFLGDGVTHCPVEQLPLARAMRGETVNDTELVIRNAKRTYPLWINVRARPVTDEQGNAKGGVAVFHDITERKRMELCLKHYTAKLESMNAKLETLRRTDGLTGILNRPAFDEELLRHLAAWRRRDSVFCLLLLDVDHFKRFNDQHGHQAGDKVLQGVSEVIAGEVREEDVLSRYGGEEFAIILPSTRIDEAAGTAARLRAEIARSSFAFGAALLKVAISAGVAEVQPGDDAREILRRADIALYAAKDAGRNCCCYYDGKDSHLLPDSPAAGERDE